MSGDEEWEDLDISTTTVGPPVEASETMLPYGIIALALAATLLIYGFRQYRKPRPGHARLAEKMVDPPHKLNDVEGDEDAFLGDGGPGSDYV